MRKNDIRTVDESAVAHVFGLITKTDRKPEMIKNLQLMVTYLLMTIEMINPVLRYRRVFVTTLGDINLKKKPTKHALEVADRKS